MLYDDHAKPKDFKPIKNSASMVCNCRETAKMRGKSVAGPFYSQKMCYHLKKKLILSLNLTLYKISGGHQLTWTEEQTNMAISTRLVEI